MAEFQEVMRQWVRVRKATASSTEENVLSVYPLEEYDDALIADIEKNVMAWAAEHPEQEYPTWREYLTSIGVIPKAEIMPTERLEFVYGDFSEAFALTNTRIDADIAQKLGIKPKENIC